MTKKTINPHLVEAIDSAYSDMTRIHEQVETLVGVLIASGRLIGKNGADVTDVLDVIAEKQAEAMRCSSELWDAMTEVLQ